MPAACSPVNRGCIVDEREQVVRYHRSATLWITCLAEFRDWRVPLARPNRWKQGTLLAVGKMMCKTTVYSLVRA